MRTAISFLVWLICINCLGQDKKKWNVNDPGGPFKEIKFAVTEGTWMNLDVSPDGKEIVFDLLGDIYAMPITGGTAKILRHGLAFEVQPRYSPDGKKILFTSDAGGGDNIWVMNRDSSDAKPITQETFRLLNNAVWSPDGQYIIARKHFTSQRSLGAGELWMYHTSGGNGLQLTPRKNDQQDLNEPSASADGKYVYYSEDIYPGGFFQYNKDPNNQITVIKRFNREKGISEDVTGGPGGAARPQVSYNGKLLAFVKRIRTKTVLCLRNIDNGEEWPIYDKLSKDQQEAWTVFGVYTGFSWMPDDKSIVIWSGGKIIRIDIDKPNEEIIIPFNCNVKQRIADAVRFRQALNPADLKVNVIRNAVTSPDGKIVVFDALGQLWKKQLPNGTPQKVISSNDLIYASAGFESEASFSPDGRSLVYVTWSDTLSGAIYKVSLDGSSLPVKLTQEKGIYRTPSFSPDGKSIVFNKDVGDVILGSSFTTTPGIYIMNDDGTGAKLVNARGANPKFNNKGHRIYYQTGGNTGGGLIKLLAATI